MQEISSLPQNIIDQINIELNKYPEEQKRSAIMSSLQIAEKEFGYLSNHVIELVANYLGIPPTQAMEVATFYNMYNLKPTGKHKISICTNLPCALLGSVDNYNYLREKLKLTRDEDCIQHSETTKDGKFTICSGECMGACGDATVAILNNRKMILGLNKEKIDQLINELEKDV